MMKDPSKNGKLREVFFRHRKKCEAWCLWGIPRWNGIHEDFTSIFATNFTQKLDFNGFHYGFDWTRGFPRGFPMALFEPSAGLARTELLEAFETLALPADAHAPVAPRMPAGGFYAVVTRELIDLIYPTIMNQLYIYI